MSTTALSPRISPPRFLELVAHPLRWRLLTELASSDLLVRELAGRMREKQGLISYHLGRLRSAKLVTMRRSNADGRDAYYTVDLPRFNAMIRATAGSLHPGLESQVELDPAIPAATGRVLFLCTGNSARSQMAEALCEHLSAGAATAKSAGSNPRPLHPLSVRVMTEHGFDISGRPSTHVSEYLNDHFDAVVTLCDKMREVCPGFPGHPFVTHWSLPDPSQFSGSDEEVYAAFQSLAADIATRTKFLLARIYSMKEHPEENSNG